MTMQELKVFEEKQVRTVWDEVQEKWYFSIVDVVNVLTESKDYLTARKYWNKLKQRLLLEGNETVTNCHQLKMLAADGKYRSTDVGDLEQILRLVQSIPSKKAEPFKRWLAHVGAERIHQMQDPELGIKQSLMDYKRLGYSDNWINQRLKSIEIRKDLTDQWKAHNVQEGVQYATLLYQHVMETIVTFKTTSKRSLSKLSHFASQVSLCSLVSRIGEHFCSITVLN